MTTTRELRRQLTPVGIGIVLLGIVYMFLYHPPFGTLTCKMKSAPGDPHAEYVYEAKFSLWKVKQIHSTETITSRNQAILELFQELEKKEHEKYKNLKHYSITTSIKEKELVITTTTDYSKGYEKELEKLEGTKKQKTVKINKLKQIYQKNGAICSYR